MTPKCGNCKYCLLPHPMDPTAAPVCRRYPPVVLPVVVVVDQGGAGTFRPQVSEENWCGEYEPRETGEA